MTILDQIEALNASVRDLNQQLGEAQQRLAAYDALSLVGYRLRRVDCTAPWSTLELLVAYDWAMRIHLRAAGNSIRERPIPSRLVETL